MPHFQLTPAATAALDDLAAHGVSTTSAATTSAAAAAKTAAPAASAAPAALAVLHFCRAAPMAWVSPSVNKLLFLQCLGKLFFFQFL